MDNCGLYYIGNYDGTPLSIEDAKSKNFDEKTEFKDMKNCLWDEFKNKCYDNGSRGTDYEIPCVCDDIEIYLSCSYRIVLDENEPEIINGDDLKEIEFFEVIG